MVIDKSTRAADLLVLMADDPVTVTVYRRVDNAPNEVEIATFAGRIDPVAVRLQIETISPVGTFSRQSFVLQYPSTVTTDVKNRDELKAVYGDGREVQYRALSFHDYGWKKECVMEQIR